MADKGKILVVDDDRLVLATLSHGLAQAGYDVIDADNGDDAILLAREHKPDLALLDIRMEGMSGFDVAAYLRDHLHMPFMFLSAFADDETVQKVKELGAVAYLVKPLDIGQIVPTVAAAFANLPARARSTGEVGALAGAAVGVPSGLGVVTGAGMGMGLTPQNPVPGGATALAAVQASTSLPVPPSAQASELVAMAVGVLMHRYSLQRGQALQRLQKLASDERRGLADQAERLVEAVELLARPGAA